MKDRIPTYPGRVKLTPVDVANGIYDLERADEPTEVGTKLNKANLLSDLTSLNIFGDSIDHTVNEALQFFADKPKIETGTYVGTGTYSYTNRNSLTFSFAPQMLIVYGVPINTDVSTYANQPEYSVMLHSNYYVPSRSGSGIHILRTQRSTSGTLGGIAINFLPPANDGKTWSWYWGPASGDTAPTDLIGSIFQLNCANTTYFYIAIG